MIFTRCYSILKRKRLSFVVVFFYVSGGSLVTVSIAEHAELQAAVYYAVAAIITLKN